MDEEAIFRITATRGHGFRTFHEVTPVAASSLSRILATRVKNHYFDEEAARRRLVEAGRTLTIFDGSAFTPDEEEIEAALAEERDAVLPAAWSGDRPRQLDVQRSEFAEIIASEVLGRLFETKIPASRISHKEVPDQQTRGADVLGLEEGSGANVVLILSEVKGSQHLSSPPAVVSGMVEKLRQLSTNRRVLLQELIWLRDHSTEAYASECARICASFILRKQDFELLLVPILIRSKDTAQVTDPGPFETAENFVAPIRWISVIIDGDLFEVAAETYRHARDGAA